MENILVTGATGFIGSHLALKLAEDGNTVHGLYRNENKKHLLNHPNIKPVKGHLLDSRSLEKAMEGCNRVYHVAAFAKAWARNGDIIYQLNVNATENLLKIALEKNIQRLVFTSTAGIYGPSINGIIREDSPPSMDYFTAYEHSKAMAGDLIQEYIGKGLDAVIVNPSRVYGPGQLSESNAVTKMIDLYRRGRWRILPGNGNSKGNYVYIDDVVDGHVSAMDRGKKGEKYLLAGENVSYKTFFDTVAKVHGKKYWLVKLPLPVMLFIARFMVFITKITGIPPFIVPALVRKFNYNWEITNRKATSELGIRFHTVEEGIKKTYHWLIQKKQ
jgi:farnesol dehydrogenase